MVLFIRNKDNDTILDLEVYASKGYVELKSVIDVENYSIFLLENLNKSKEIIEDFQELSELRGWLWEVYFMAERNTSDKYNDVLEILRVRIKEIAKKYDLYYVED